MGVLGLSGALDTILVCLRQPAVLLLREALHDLALVLLRLCRVVLDVVLQASLVFGEVLADVRVWFDGSFAEGCAVCRAVHLRRNAAVPWPCARSPPLFLADSSRREAQCGRACKWQHNFTAPQLQEKCKD